MATVEVSLEDVTVCVPCTPNGLRGEHHESHAESARVLFLDRIPETVSDDVAAAALVYRARNALKVTGPLTVHRSSLRDIAGGSFTVVREWAVTQP